MGFDKISLKGRALRLLAGREHSRAELEKKLAGWQGEKKLLDARLAKVVEMRYFGGLTEAEVAEALGFVFRHLRWDAEEDLSRVLGDIAAHRLVDGGRRFAAEGRRSLERAGGGVAEYLTEEAPLLVPRSALPAFAQEVVALRDAVARLDKRIARIEKGR